MRPCFRTPVTGRYNTHYLAGKVVYQGDTLRDLLVLLVCAELIPATPAL